MTRNLFAHGWARLDRAGEVAERMAQLWSDYLATDPYSTSFVGQRDGVYILRVLEDNPAPVQFAVAVGEWINHLRSALDYTIWATAAHEAGVIPPPEQGRIQYPIFDGKDGWDRNLSRLATLADHQRQWLLRMQPFSGDRDANFLGWVNRIARSDRHRQLSQITGYIVNPQPAVEAPHGSTLTRQWGERTFRDGAAEVARFVVSPWHPGLEISVNPRLGIDPDIEEWSRSPFWSQIPFSHRLPMLQTFVAAQIATFEYDCTGSSRDQDVLSEGFRAECDERRRKRQLPKPRRARPPVEWGDAEPVQLSDRTTLAGDDYPPHGPGPIP